MVSIILDTPEDWVEPLAPCARTETPTSELNTRYRMSIRSVNCAALVALGDNCC